MLKQVSLRFDYAGLGVLAVSLVATLAHGDGSQPASIGGPAAIVTGDCVVPDYCHELPVVVAPDEHAASRFGYAVAADSDFLVVGDPGYGSPGSYAGIAHFYNLVDGHYQFDASVIPPGTVSPDQVGQDVAIHGHVAAISAPGRACLAGPECGSVTVYQYMAHGWTLQSTLTSPNPAARNRFGGAVVFADVIAVGEPGYDCELGPDCGVVHVFRRNGTAWDLETSLVPANRASDDHFGYTLAVAADEIFVASSRTEDPTCPTCGEVNVFRLIGGVWTEQQTLLPPYSTFSSSNYGATMRHSDSVLIVGASQRPCDPEPGNACGAAYVYDTDSEHWNLRTTLIAPHPDNEVYFGTSVAIQAGRAFVGSLKTACASQDLASAECGAVYVFDLNQGTPNYAATIMTQTPSVRTRFASAIALTLDRVIVGAYADHTAYGERRGRVHVFTNGQLGPDCDCDGSADSCELVFGTGNDCNRNSVLDSCEIESGTVTDCDLNGVPDGCDGDCQGNGTPDECEIANGTTRDCNGDSVPDICPIVTPCEIASLAPEEPGASSYGKAMSCESHRLLVSAPYQSCAEGPQCGAVYAYSVSANQVTDEGILRPHTPHAGDWFGYSVAVQGDLAVAGAHLNDGPDPHSPLFNSGAAYVFVRAGNEWAETQTLRPSNAASGDVFGSAVATDGNRIAISAPAGGDSNIGMIYVFQPINGLWAEVRRILTSTDGPIAISGDVLVVSVFAGSGLVKVFRLLNGQWSLESTLVGTSTVEDAGFGESMAYDGEWIVVGAPFDPCPGSVPFAPQCGAVYIFRRQGEEWIQLAKLRPPSGMQMRYFGRSVAVSGTLVAVGGTLVECGAAGSPDCGTVLSFEFDGADWSFANEMHEELAGSSNVFGSSTCVSGGQLAVGARDVESAAPGTAYVYQLSGADCDCNGVVDTCDIRAGTAPDANANGIPDLCDGDLASDGDVDMPDVGWMFTCFAGHDQPIPTECLSIDLDYDGDYDLADWARTVPNLSGPH